jgi:hypothetical protein
MIKLKSIYWEIRKENSLKEGELILEKIQQQVEKDFGPQNESEEDKEKFKQKILAEIKEETKLSPPKSSKQLLKEIRAFSKSLLEY